MQPLHVSIHDPRTGRASEAVFHASPVRIGRNALNDLALEEPSVSQWHAQLSFDHEGLYFTDVGSSNGSRIDGIAIAAHRAIRVEPGAALEVGPLLLRARRGEGERGAARRPPMVGSDDALTTICSELDVAGPLEGEALPTELGSVDPQTAVASSLSAQLHYLHAVLSAVGAARAEYFGVVRDHVESLPSDARAQIVPQLAREYPDLLRAPEFDRIAAEHGVGGVRGEDASPVAWLERLSGKPALGARGEEIGDARALARIAALLRMFAQSLVELLRTRAQLGRELGVGGAETLPQSAPELLAYLLDFGVDGEERAATIQRAFAELAVHQLALVGATREGVRGLLEDLAPEQVASRSRGGWLAGLRAAAGHPAWDEYQREHADLAEGDRCVQRVFGARFARSYLTTMGRARPAPSESPRAASTSSETEGVPPTRIRPCAG